MQTDDTSKAGEQKTIQFGPKMRTLKQYFRIISILLTT